MDKNLIRLLTAPLFGLMFCIFMPFIGIAFAAYAVGARIKKYAADHFWRTASFNWRPSEAYFWGKKKKSK